MVLLVLDLVCIYIHVWFLRREFCNTGAIFFVLFPCKQSLTGSVLVLNIWANFLKGSAKPLSAVVFVVVFAR